MTCDVPVVFIIFRRPDLTEQVFQVIRQVQPAMLLVVADGPRNEEEAVLCHKARAVTEEVDWKCEVLRNYSDVNLGCRKRVSSGLDWAFTQVGEAIMLEDDCLPHISFFSYCQELLERYRYDQRIWCISGINFQDDQYRGDSSYYFSNYTHVWGWASWRRAWQKYDHDLTYWPKFRDNQYLTGILDSHLEAHYWQAIFERFHTLNEPDTWDYAWLFTCWLHRGLTTIPNTNLVSNIGFRDDATHTIGISRYANLETEDIGKLRHPEFISRDSMADIYTFDHHFDGLHLQKTQRWQSRLRNRLRTLKQFLLQD